MPGRKRKPKARGRSPAKPRAAVPFRKGISRDVGRRLKALEKLVGDGRPRSTLELAALDRQKRDLLEGHKRGLTWDEAAAERAIRFFSLLKHYKGEWAGKPLIPEPWQEHGILAPLFGWKRPDGTRRFRTAYAELPRKNGKTTIASGIADQGLVADGEEGAEIYAAATQRDQACLLFNDAVRCLGNDLKRILKPQKWCLTFDRTNSFFKPLSADYDSLDGLNIHRAVVDELHAHKHRGLWDVLMTATGARRQPLVMAITTAGADEQTICGEVRKLATDVLESDRADHDDAFFAFIACAELEDDWQSPSTWRKANPNFGISVKEDRLADICRLARASKASENNFRRKHLNQWICGVSEWVTKAAWRKCRIAPDEFPHEELRTLECYSAIDLGWRDDFAAQGNLFVERSVRTAEDDQASERIAELADSGVAPPAPVAVIRRAFAQVKLWVPSHGRRDISEAPLVDWIDQGLVTVCPGNSVEVGAILRSVLADAEQFDLRQIALDPNNARQLGNQLEALGLPRFEFRQSKWNYHEPCTELANLVAGARLFHDGNEVLEWMIGNVRLEANSAGYVMPTKEKSKDKIDGVVALLMALGLALFAPIEGESIYSQAGAGIL